MRRLFSLFLALVCLGVLGSQVQARNVTLTVVFKPGTETQFIELIRSTFKVRVLKKEQLTYVFEVPALKRQEQFTELFAALPSVQETIPAPMYQLADHIQPQAVNLQSASNPADPVLKPVPVASSPVETASPSALPGGLPTGNAIITPIPMDAGGQILVNFRPATKAETIQKFHRIYGTRAVKQVSFYKYRIQLPSGLNAGTAVRIFKLFPEVTNVQRLYA